MICRTSCKPDASLRRVCNKSWKLSTSYTSLEEFWKGLNKFSEMLTEPRSVPSLEYVLKSCMSRENLKSWMNLSVLKSFDESWGSLEKSWRILILKRVLINQKSNFTVRIVCPFFLSFFPFKRWSSWFCWLAPMKHFGSWKTSVWCRSIKLNHRCQIDCSFDIGSLKVRRFA